MADGTIVINTDLDATGFTNGVKSLGSLASKGLGAVTNVVKTTSAALVGLGGAATVVGIGFESSMSQVASTMGLTVEEINAGSESFELLRQAAKDAGATTKYSASQSADALNYLALAGYSAEQSVNALPKVLNLASAGNLDLAYASDLVTDSMSALGLEMSELDSFTDKLSKTSQISNTSISQLGEAILTVGGTAKILSGGTTELNAALGILADSGTKGSDAGTALRNVILSLTAPTDKAAQQMKSLGVEVADAQGNLRPLNEIFKDLNSSLGDMTDVQKQQVLNNIFNKVDLKSVESLLKDCGGRYDELTEKIINSEGATSKSAETQSANLKGMLDTLRSALESLGIEIYESIDVGLKDSVDGAVENIRRLTDAFKENGFDGLIKESANIMTEFFEKIAEQIPQASVTAIRLVTTFINSMLENLPSLASSGIQIAKTLINSILIMLPEFLKIGLDVITEFGYGIQEMLPEVLKMGSDTLENLLLGITDKFPEIVHIGLGIISKLIETLLGMLPDILSTGITVLVELVNGIAKTLPELIPVAIDALLTLIDTLVDNIDLLIDCSIELIMALADGLIEALPILIEKAPIIIDKLLTAIADNLPKLMESGVTLIIKLAEGLIQAIPQLVSKIPQLITSILNAIGSYYKSFYEGGSVIVQKIGDGLLSMVGTLISSGGSIISSLIESVTNAASGFFNIGKDIVSGIWNGITSMGNWITEKVSGFFSGIVTSAKKVLGIHSPSRVFRDQVGKFMAEGVGVGFEQESDNVEKDIQSNLEDITATMRHTVEVESSNIGTRLTPPTSENISETTPGITQNVTIVNPERTPAENARELKRVGRELLNG